MTALKLLLLSGLLACALVLPPLLVVGCRCEPPQGDPLLDELSVLAVEHSHRKEAAARCEDPRQAKALKEEALRDYLRSVREAHDRHGRPRPSWLQKQPD